MDLIAAVADQTDLPRAKATEVVDAVFGAIEGALKNKEEVRLVGFGTFATAERKAGTGRNPRTGEEMAIPASTTVRFKAGKGLKDAVWQCSTDLTRAVSSAVERLVYTERVGGSNPSPPTNGTRQG